MRGCDCALYEEVRRGVAFFIKVEGAEGARVFSPGRRDGAALCGDPHHAHADRLWPLTRMAGSHPWRRQGGSIHHSPPQREAAALPTLT
jgi:hypothetical protein